MSGPLPWFLQPVTLPASWVYGWAVNARNHRYDRGGAIELDRPVISVGNITAGGTGKTPVVTWLVERLLRADERPIIAMRGYGANAAAGEVSDEQAEYIEQFGDRAPVVAHPDRAAALQQFLKQQPDTTCVVLDDGFQHRKLKRDLDLVLVDATRPGLDDALLPAGWLREPAANLKRATGVIVTRANGVDARLAARIERCHGKPPLGWCRHAWRDIALVGGGNGERRDVPTSWLHGKRVITMLGVGNPESVLQQLREAGADVLAGVPARDHERYDQPKLAMARLLCEESGAEGIVVTWKDWVKLRRLIEPSTWPIPIIVPRLAIEFIAGEEALMQRIEKSKNRNGVNV